MKMMFGGDAGAECAIPAASRQKRKQRIGFLDLIRGFIMSDCLPVGACLS